MNRLTLLVILLLASTGGLPAQSPEQGFLQGNAFFQRGQYADAIAAYEGVLQQGSVSGELYYNLGNAYYKSGNMGKAILNYERALRLMPSDEDLRHNLQLANLLITDRIEPTPRLFLWDWWEGITGTFSLGGITWLAYAMYVLLLGGIAGFLLARTYGMRKTSLVVSLTAGVLLVSAGTVLAAKVGEMNRSDEAVVTVAITTAKNSPDVQSSDAFVLHAGVKVRITDRVHGWINIRLADGKVGWVEEKAVELI